MAKDQTRRLKPAAITTDQSAYDALQSISGYSPANPAYTLTEGNALHEKLGNNRMAEAQAEAALKAARDNAAASEWAFHNYMLGVKDQVKAQYGADSNELQGLGLKKKTEYKKPSAKKKAQ